MKNFGVGSKQGQRSDCLNCSATIQTSNNLKALYPIHKQEGELKQQLHKRRTKAMQITKIYVTMYFPEFKFWREFSLRSSQKARDFFNPILTRLHKYTPSLRASFLAEVRSGIHKLLLAKYK